MGYKVLFIRDSEHLQLYLDNIKIHRTEDFITVPIGDIQMLIIDNYKCVLGTQLINKLVENNVSVVLCGMNHLPQSTILAINGYHATSGVLQQQIQWNDEMKSVLTQKIIKAKINNQAYILEVNKCSDEIISRLRSFSDEVEPFDVTNREGLASKMYFRELYGKSFVRFNEDTINAGLDYGYAIFRSLISTLLVSKGLMPNFGLFHRGKQNNFNLSDDLIEVFRPIVDDYVFNNMLGAEILTYDHRKAMIDLTTEKVEMYGKYHSIHNCINMYIDCILKCIDEKNYDLFEAPKSIIKSNV